MKSRSASLLAGSFASVAFLHAPGVSAATESVVMSFDVSNGAEPYADLLNVKGTLFGTTAGGGSDEEFGTVFSLDPTTGAEKVLHSFDANGTDGYFPEAGLINVKGTLFGTTQDGGTSGDGTVFSISTTSSEKVVYAFKGGTDGVGPIAGLGRCQWDIVRDD